MSTTTFQRCPKNKENPYAQISRDLIRDNTISPACSWLIIYLLSHKDGWTINIKQLIDHLKGLKGYGRKKIYSLVNEAVKAGYMYREKVYVSNKTHKIGSKAIYFVSESKSFSNNNYDNSKNVSDVPFSGIPETGIPESDTYKKEHIIKKEHIEEEKVEKKDAKSADADLLTTFFLSKMKAMKPNFTGKENPSSKKAAIQLLKLRSPMEIRKLIEFVLGHHFWSTVCLSLQSLLKNIDKIEMEMAKSSCPKAKSPLSVIQENKILAEKIKKKYPNRIDVSLGNSDIEFGTGTHVTTIKFMDVSFKEQVFNCLRKMSLSQEGL